MNIKNFFKYILDLVYDLNAHSLAIRNSNWQENGLRPFIKFSELDIELKGDFVILNLPKGIKLVKWEGK